MVILETERLQLRYMKQEILQKIDRRIKPGTFRDLKLFLK